MKTEMVPMRVLNLFTIMNRGGAETMVMNYYRHMDRSKIQFDFMVHREERGAFDDEIEELGGKIYRMPAIRPWTASNYRKIIREFYREHPEYNIIHSHMSELGYYDFLEAENAGVPIRICHAHNRPHGVDLKSPVRWYYKTRMMPHITHMFMCGEESGEWLFGKKNKEKFVQLNNAIDAKRFCFDEDKRKNIRETLGISGKLVFGHVGRFNRQKNHKFLIDIFAEIYKQNHNACLLLIGDDSGNDGIKIHEKVHQLCLDDVVYFMGVRTDIDNLLQAMDVFVFPSLFEGLSVASIEAQAAGLPCLLSNKIPIECKKTDFVQTMSLEASPKYWADKALQMSRVPRKNTYTEICRAGYDIFKNARWLQQFYLETIKKEIFRCQR